MIPPARPKATREQVLAAASASWATIFRKEPLPDMFLFGVRGYYRDTMGKPGTNDRGIYDDAIFVVGPQSFGAFNANTDPSAYRPGIATLRPGWHPYRPGYHKRGKPTGHPAFRPATAGEALPVDRDGLAAPSPGIAINIHRGGAHSTSSEGCQTIPPTQWDAFFNLALLEMERAGLKRLWYGLTAGPIA